MLYLTTCVGFGYGPRRNIARGFSRQHRITDFTRNGSASRLTHNAPRISLRRGPHAYPGTTTGRAQLPPCVTPSLTYYPPGPHPPPPPPPKRPGRAPAVSTAGLGVGRSSTGTGISTRSPSTTPLGLALGPDSPRAEQPAPGTLGHPAEGILTLHTLLMPAFSLARPPHLDHSGASPVARRSPTHPHTWIPRPTSDDRVTCECHSFGGVLEPRYIVGAEPLDQ